MNKKKSFLLNSPYIIRWEESFFPTFAGEFSGGSH